MKRNLFLVHKWIALVFALPLLILALTGLVISFTPKNEVPQRKGGETRPLVEVLDTIHAQSPELNIGRVNFSAASITIMGRGNAGTRLITIDRSSGEVIKNMAPKEDPFVFNKLVHESFLMQGFGKKLVAFSGLALFLVLLSGTFFWIKENFWQQLKNLYQARSLRRLRSFHIMLGITVLIPLLFTAGTGFLIEMNGLFFSDAIPREHLRPQKCSWNQQMMVLENLDTRGRGTIFMCRTDHPYLTFTDSQGSHQITPTGEEVLFIPREDWTKTSAPRKHFFVEWHGGEKFGPLGMLYNWLNSVSVLALIISGALMWWRKRNRT